MVTKMSAVPPEFDRKVIGKVPDENAASSAKRMSFSEKPRVPRSSFEIESKCRDAQPAPAGLVDGVLIVDRDRRIGRQVDGHPVATRVDDDVLRFAPRLAALVEPGKAGVHAAAGASARLNPPS